MEISWYGHSCFRMRDRGVTILTDPYAKDYGYSLPRVEADIISVSHDHAGHSNVSGMRGDPMVVDGPGEYEIQGIFVFGIPSFHDKVSGRARGKNTIFLFEFEDVSVCHLGDLGHVLDQTQTEALLDLAGLDVLLVPVGGQETINASEAAEVINILEPALVVPMHYRTEAVKAKLDPLDKFLKEMGLKKVEPESSLRVTKSGLPSETQVVVMEHSG